MKQVVLILLSMTIAFGQAFPVRKNGETKFYEIYAKYTNINKLQDPELEKAFHTIKKLRKALRKDGYKTKQDKVNETIKAWEKQGLSKEEIMNRKDFKTYTSDVLNMETEIIANPEKHRNFLSKHNIKIKDISDTDNKYKLIVKNGGADMDIIKDDLEQYYYYPPSKKPIEAVKETVNHSYYKSELTPDGDFRFYYIDEEGNETYTVFSPGVNAKVTLKAKVEKAGKYYKYIFDLYNDSQSRQSIWRVGFEYNTEIIDNSRGDMRVHLDWVKTENISVLTFASLGEETDIKSGESSKNYYITSGIPGIVKYYVLGREKLPNTHSPISGRGFGSGYSLNGKTIGAVKFPWEGIPELEGIDTDKMKPHFKKRLPFLKAWDTPRKFNAMIDRLLDYTEQSYEEGWIEEADTKQWIIDSLNDIRNLYNDNKRRETKRAINEFLNDIEPYRDRDRLILTEAYGLLKYNLEYVRDNLM